MPPATLRLLSCVALACLAVAGSARAATVGADGVLQLSLCIEENPYPPQIYADRDGAIPILVKMAARAAGLRVAFHRAPYLRCVAEVRSGQSDGYPSTPARNDSADAFVFPGYPAAPDAARATVSARVLVYRRVGTPLAWNGRAFSGLAGPVLHDRNGLLVARRLRAMSVAGDSSAKNAEGNLSKLLAGRGDAVVSFEAAASPLLATPRFAGKVEALAVPFFVDVYYLGIAPTVYARHRDKIEALWQAIGRLRKSEEYAAAIRDLPPR